MRGCHRRCLKALRYLLQAWPMPSGLADDWSNLGVSLKMSGRSPAMNSLLMKPAIGRLIHAVEAALPVVKVNIPNIRLWGAGLAGSEARVAMRAAWHGC